MHFRCFTPDLANVDKVIVDGNECGIGLQLSHWPGNTTPRHLRADLSVEIALRLAADPYREQLISAREIVTNDHYDTDGVLAAWVLLHPKQALDHASALIATAETGDFYEFTTPAALQADLTIQAFADRQRSRLADSFTGRSEGEVEQQATDAVLAELPGLLYDADRHRPLWEEEFAGVVERLAWFNDGYVEVREHPTARLTVLRTQRPLDHFCRNAFSRGHRILEIRDTDTGTYYALHYREFLWYEIVSRSTSPRHKLSALADRLNALEPAPSSGAWTVTEWTPALLFAESGNRATRVVPHKETPGHSMLDPAIVTQLVNQELRNLDDECTRDIVDRIV